MSPGTIAFAVTGWVGIGFGVYLVVVWVGGSAHRPKK
mgnify:CR=1 FL=1